MKKYILPMLLFGLLSFTATAGSTCDNGRNIFGRGLTAIEKIQNTEFDFVQEFKTLNLMGIRKATFYSCGAGDGYMIVDRGGRQPELYRNVPRDLWETWKQSNHIDFFYQRFIRNNPFYL